MLDVFKNEGKKTTTAVINESSADALMHILKKLGISAEREGREVCIETTDLSLNRVFRLQNAKMNEKYTGTVTCHEEDSFDEKTGEDLAVKKAMDNHKNGFRKAIIRWQAAMIKEIMEVSPDTFKEALHKVVPCKCKHSEELDSNKSNVYNENKKEIYYLEKTVRGANMKVKATMEIIGDSYILKAGAILSPVVHRSTPQINDIRNKMNIKNNILKQDFIFKSPSRAAMVVTGLSTNGWNAWKDKDGNTLDSIKRRS